MAYVSTKDYGQTYITVDISGLSASQKTYGGFRFRIDGGSWRNVSVDSSYTGYDSPNYTFSGLTAGTSYYIEGEAYTNSWYPADAKFASTDTAPIPVQTATPTGFSMTASSSSEIYMTWSSVSGASYYQVALYSPISVSNTVYGTSYYWGGLSANTTYYGYVRAYSTSGGWSNWSSFDNTTTQKGRPVNFSWDLSKTSGANFNITASEWNGFFNKINEFRDYKNLSYYSFTSAYRGNTLTASQYNEARNAISQMNPSTSIPSYRNTGDIIYASDINRLRDSLNSI